MSVQRRPKTGKPKTGTVKWVVRYRDPAGKEHSRTFTTEKAAKAYDAKQARDIAMRTWQDPTTMKITVGEMYDRWMSSIPRRESTLALYRHTRRQIEPLADWPAADITTSDVLAWYQTLTTGRPWISREDKGLTPRTARDALRRLRSAFLWGIENGFTTRNPVVLPKTGFDTVVVDPVTIPTLDEINRVIDRVRDGGAVYEIVKRPGEKPRTYTQLPQPTIAEMMVTSMLTGMRINEVCGLIVADLDLDAGIIRLTQQLNAHTRERGPLKSRAGRRDIPVAEQLAPILRDRVKGKRPGDWVFSGDQGGAMWSTRMAVRIARAARHEGAERVHFHALRHFFASSLITAGRPIHEVSAVMGHSSAAMTLNVYTHVLDRSGAGMRDAIGSAIGCGISAGSRHLRAVPETGS